MTYISSFRIRPAIAADQKAIRTLIHDARINILGLDWRRFYIAVDQEDRLIGCGQVKLHKDGTRELASIAVEKSWQGRGIARGLIESLISKEDGHLWLICRSGLVPFYERFGFKEIAESSEMPLFFQRVRRLWILITKATMGRRSISVMFREGDLPATSQGNDII